jgi:SAM-dependent methyltransferase
VEKLKIDIVKTEACCGPDCCSSGTDVNTSDIKQEIRKQYGKIALSNGTHSCCGPECCSPSDLANNPIDSTKLIGYSHSDLQSIPEASILGVGCGAPLNFAEPKDGETVVDLGSGAGIDVFLSANRVGNNGKVIGIDMTDEMLEKARANAKQHGYNNVEFRKGDIEQTIPVENDSVDLVISNCVINLTTDKTDAFKQVHRILKSGGRMVISDMVTDKEVAIESADAGLWCGCIDGALTKEHYLDSIKQAGFSNVEVLQERPYNDGGLLGGRKMSSLILRAVK